MAVSPRDRGHYTRRGFLKGLGAAAGASLLIPGRHLVAQPSVSRVASVTDGAAWRGPGWGDADLDPGALHGMLGRCLEELTGEADPVRAAAALFPDLSAARVGIKVNCVNRDLPTHPKAVDALVRILVEAGAQERQVIVFDRSDDELTQAGFVINEGPGHQVYGTSHEGLLFADDLHFLSDGPVRLSRIVAERVDYLVSFAVLKHHEMAGVTLTLKNHFGSIDQPATLHGRDRDCTPGVGEVCALPTIRERTRLALIDGTFGSYRSGLGGRPDFAPMTLVAGVDPVATDAVGQELINTRRRLDRLPGLDAPHLRDAAARGLGVGDLAHIELRSTVLNPPPEREPPWGGSSCGCRGAGASVASGMAVALVGAAAGALGRHGRNDG